MSCSGLCPRSHVGGFGLLRIALVWQNTKMWMLPRRRHRKLSLSSVGVQVRLFFDVVPFYPSPSTSCVGFSRFEEVKVRVGWVLAWDAGMRAKNSTRKVTSSAQKNVQEMFKPRAARGQEPQEPRICDSPRSCFSNSTICPCPRVACRIRLSVLGRSPAHVQACWAGTLGDVISLHFWEG